MESLWRATEVAATEAKSTCVDFQGLFIQTQSEKMQVGDHLSWGDATDSRSIRVGWTVRVMRAESGLSMRRESR